MDPLSPVSEDKDDDAPITQNNIDFMVDIGLPDISWDLDRLNPPTEVPTSSPVVVVNTPSPVTPAPVTPEPSTSQPTITWMIPGESTRTYSPTYYNVRPTTPEPSSSPTNLPSLLSSTTDDETTTDETTTRTYFSCPPPSPTTLTRQVNGTNVSIEIDPPISTVRIAYDFQLQLLAAQQQQEQEEEELEEIMSKLEIQLETSLGTYMKNNTTYQEDDGEEECEGYNVDEFRRRRRRNLADDNGAYGERFGLQQPKNMDGEQAHLHLQRQRRARADDIVETEQSTTKTVGEVVEEEEEDEMPTKIIGISSVKSLSIDDTRECTPTSPNCYIVHGELDATYVGYNEAGVTSSISRAVKQQMMMVPPDSGNSSSENNNNDNSSSDDPTYTIQYLAQDDTQEGGSRLANTPSVFANLINGYKESLPEISDDLQLSPYGVGILGSLGVAFLMVCYVLFIKSDNNDREKTKKELKKSKKKALCEYDDSSNGQQSEGEQSYCYDLESVAIDYNNDNGNNVNGDDNAYREDGVEVRSLGGRPGAVAVGASSRSSDETKKMSNKAHDVNYNDVQNMPSLLESVDEESSSGAGSISSSNVRGPRAVSPLDAGVSVRSNTPSPSERTPFAGLLFSRSGEQGGRHTPLVDRIPSSTRGSPNSMELSPQGNAQIYQLPSISESTLPPPMNDTPHVVVTDRTTSKKKDKKKSRISEETEEEQFEV